MATLSDCSGMATLRGHLGIPAETLREEALSFWDCDETCGPGAT